MGLLAFCVIVALRLLAGCKHGRVTQLGARGRARRGLDAGSRRYPWVAIPLAIFFLARLVDAGIIWWLAQNQSGDTPGYADLVTRADGNWYERIVQEGYPSELPVVDGQVQQNQWVFYPLYPALIRSVTFFGVSFEDAAQSVSLVCAAAACCLLYALVRRQSSAFVATTTVTALATFPASPTFQMAYTEGLALLLILLVLTAVARRRYPLALLGLLLVGLTRPIVLAFGPLFALLWWLRWRARDETDSARHDRWWLAGLTLATPAVFLIWPAVAWGVTGRRDAYTATQYVWLADAEGTSWRSWVHRLVVERDLNIAIVSVLAVAFATFALLRRGARLWGSELRLWAGGYFIYLLLATRPTSSIFRYAMLGVIPWWPAPELGADASRSARCVILIGIAALGFAGQVLWIDWLVLRPDGSINFP